ncbi:MAG: hypothetical protein NTW03_00145 [Verrucomicrobia bacterium]|nr:hypothetical protein [Verrucomicrobiota bacterium]
MNSITLRISGESIYGHSLARAIFTAEEAFTVQLTGSVITLARGKKGDQANQIHAVEQDGSFGIEVDLLGWIQEKAVGESDCPGPQNRYGMRFYPFVSSFFTANITTTGGSISDVILDLPDAYRLIWYGARVIDPSGRMATLSHAYGPARSQYILSWEPKPAAAGEFVILVPVRHGANEILKIVNFPVYYFLLSLLGITLAWITTGKASFVLAAVGATWTFMLKKWSNSNLPQRNTLLTRAYIIAGGIAPVWGLAWLGLGLWSLLLVFPIGLMIRLVSRSVEEYRLKGGLPRSVAAYWSKRIELADKTQRSSWSVPTAVLGNSDAVKRGSGPGHCNP